MRNRHVLEEILTVFEAAQTADRAATTAPTAILREGLDNIRAMLRLEDEGWEIFQGGTAQPEEGLTLDDLKRWAARIHEQSLVGWMKKGFSLRSSYIWQGGIQYDGIPSESRGRGTNVQEKIDDPINQRAFFSPQARIRREKRLYAEGIALWIGNDATKKLEAIPLSQITATLGDPDDESIIWAYKREWSRRQNNGKYKDMKRWYFVDTYKDKELTQITLDGKPVQVETGYTAFDLHANSVEGWAFGFPDALGAWIWNERAKEAYGDGLDVTAAMASIMWTMTGSTNKASQNAALQFASPQGAASTAVVGAGNSLSAMSTAGKAYDFSKLREIVAVMATSLDVSAMAITGNSADAGSSYGAASVLEMPVKLAMEFRRLEHVELDKRVLKWMAGPTASKGIEVYFKSLDDGADIYRRLQAVTLPWLQGVITDEVYKSLVAGILGVPNLGATPAGMLLPNNKDSLGRSDVDADGAPTGSTGSPTQGRASGDGGAADRATDTRNDIISK